jgi:hypothetical protein
MHFGDVQDPQEFMQTPRKESLKAEKLCFFATEMSLQGVNKILSTPGSDAGPLKL